MMLAVASIPGGLGEVRDREVNRREGIKARCNETEG